MNQHQYQVQFLVGAKLLSSFDSAMRQAQARMKALQRTAKETSEAVKLIGSAMKTALAGVAAFAAGAVFKKIFTGAFDAAAEAQEHALALTNEFYLHMKKQGRDAAAAQADMLEDYNRRLAQTGVISKSIYDTMAVSLSKIGESPRQIAELEPVLADVLVHARGIRASTEDAKELGDTLVKVAKGGRAMALKQFIPIGPSEMARLRAYKDDWRGALYYITYLMKKYQGFNDAAARTPLGQIQRMRNLFDELSKKIGREMLPAQADMAKAWSDALPDIEPVILDAMRELATLITWITREAVALAQRLEMPEVAKVWHEIGDTFKELWTTLGLEWPQSGFFGRLLGGAIVRSLKILNTELKLLVKLMEALAAVVKKLPPVLIGSFIAKHFGINRDVGRAAPTALATMPPIPPQYASNPVLREAYLQGAAPGVAAPSALPTPAYAAPGGAGYGPQTAPPAPPVTSAPWAAPVSRVPAIPATPTTTILGAGGGPAGGGAGYIPAGATMSYGGGESSLGPRATAGATLYGKLLTQFRQYPPQGLPPDAARFGIVKGTPEEWARWGVSVAPAESGFNPRSTNLSDPGGSFGVFQYSHGQAYGNAYDVDKSVAAFVRDANSAAGSASIRGSILGKRFSTIGMHPDVGTAYLGQAQQIAAAQAAAAPAANAPPPLLAAAYQQGGIALRPQIAALAERGPEAILPLGGRGPLSVLGGLLGGGSRGSGIFNLHHAPEIHIHGNADEHAMGRMSTRLRDAAREFIREFQAAQRQERRLSYESGYGS